MNLVTWWKINIKKENLLKISEAFRSRLFSEGSITKKLEEKIKKTLRVKHVILTTSGTSAILILLIHFSKKFPTKRDLEKNVYKKK